MLHKAHKNKATKHKHKLRTPSDLTRHLGVKEDYLREIVRELDCDETKLYRSWERPKHKGSVETRPIDEPKAKLKFIQERINEKILQRTQIHKAACGGIRGKGLLNNLQPHVGQPMVLTLDLKNCFPNITNRHVYNMFCAIGASPDVAKILTRLTTFKGRVPQGAPTSTMIANLVAGYGGRSCLDGRIEGLCRKHGSNSSRWVDDITISGPTHLRKLGPTVEKIIEQSGFKPNREKTRCATKSEAQQVTCHLVNVKPNIKKSEKRKLRALLYKCKMQVPQLCTNESAEKLKQQLRGKIAHYASVNPEQGAKFLKEFKSINWQGE